ncbi:MAG: LCP family protein [Lachnospiraceae bacterium]|nr:LCP family protein [Lachnospiraceae bacterium]
MRRDTAYKEQDIKLYDVRDFQEDWDSKEHLQKMAAKRKKKGKGSAKQTTAQGSSKQSHKKKKGKKKSGFKRFLITLVLLLALCAGGMYYIVGLVYDKMNYKEIDSLTSAPIKDEGIINILLIGSDSRTGGEDGRSDAMILLSVNHATNQVYMTSLLRDMYVEIPGYKGNRLNAAYSYGGAELLLDTVEHNLDIDVNRYVLVNFEAFAKLVDAVGGIDLELTKEEIEYVNGYLVEYNILMGRAEGTDYMDTSVGGMVHLNGPQALAYSRNRYIGTDFGRTERQRKILSAVIDKFPKAALTNPKEMINGIMPNLTTNLTQGECYRLCFTAAGALAGYEIVQGSIPVEGTYSNATIRDMAVLEVDFEANKQYIRDTIYKKE